MVATSERTRFNTDGGDESVLADACAGGRGATHVPTIKLLWTRRSLGMIDGLPVRRSVMYGTRSLRRRDNGKLRE